MIDVSSMTISMLSTWGESIHYLPDSSGSTTAGEGRELLAIVDRAPASALPEASSTLRPGLTVYVANRSTALTLDDDSNVEDPGGISAEELDRGADIVTLPVVEGGDAKTMRVHRIAAQDPGMLRLEVR